MKFPFYISIVELTYHHLNISGQSLAESDRSCAERTSCCSGYSRGCCCHLEDINARHIDKDPHKHLFKPVNEEKTIVSVFLQSTVKSGRTLKTASF